MRHRVFGKKLGRNTHSRKHLLENLASSLLVQGKITTTQTKAKWLRPYVEKMIRKSVKNRLISKRDLATDLTSEAFKKLVFEIGPGFSTKTGGYAKIIKLNPRGGDNAPMAKIELLAWDKSKAVTLTKTPKPKRVARKKTVAKEPSPEKVVKAAS